MVTCEKMMKHINARNYELLSKQGTKEVYKVLIDNNYYLLKLFGNEVNFKREISALNLFKGKYLPVPEIYTFSSQKVIENGLPYYLLEEFLPGVILKESFASYSDQQKHDALYKCGALIGKLNTAFTQDELKESGLWKYGYEGVASYNDYLWTDFNRYHLPHWLKNIRIKEEDVIDYEHVVNLIIKGLKAIELGAVENDKNIGFLHRDYGFRNIIMNDKLPCVIDFEYALIGDIHFDLSKLIFNDLCFKNDKALRMSFFNGWEKSTNLPIDMKRLWLYLAIQGLGAIQWVDKLESEASRKENEDYRSNGQTILLEAYPVLMSEFG